MAYPRCRSSHAARCSRLNSMRGGGFSSLRRSRYSLFPIDSHQKLASERQRRAGWEKHKQHPLRRHRGLPGTFPQHRARVVHQHSGERVQASEERRDGVQRLGHIHSHGAIVSGGSSQRSSTAFARSAASASSLARCFSSASVGSGGTSPVMAAISSANDDDRFASADDDGFELELDDDARARLLVLLFRRAGFVVARCARGDAATVVTVVTVSVHRPRPRRRRRPEEDLAAIRPSPRCRLAVAVLAAGGNAARCLPERSGFDRHQRRTHRRDSRRRQRRHLSPSPRHARRLLWRVRTTQSK